MATEGSTARAHLQCPYCASYAVDRLFIASIDVDSCQCTTCGARWDEDRTTGEYKGRLPRTSIIVPRND
jgi:hypothetical protein